MRVMNDVTRTSGKRTIQFTSAGIRNARGMKRGHMPPAYVARWDELPAALAH